MPDSRAPSFVSSSTPAPRLRRLPAGADVVGPGRTHFRVWAPPARSITLVLGARTHSLEPEDQGYWSIEADAMPGERYHYRVDDSERLYPDPASRFQPEGTNGAS